MEVHHVRKRGDCVSKSPDVMVVLGTRPEAIKLASVVRALRRQEVNVSVLTTGQQGALLDDALQELGLVSQYKLHPTESDRSLASSTSRILKDISGVLVETGPRLVVVQGDTTSTFCGAMSSFLNMIPVAHVEAGLRTYNMKAPYPEEGYRQLVSRIARWHFAPTSLAVENLVGEGVPSDRIFHVGNTFVDDLGDVHRAVKEMSEPTILVTLHRRENAAKRLVEICRGIMSFLDDNKQYRAVVVLHPNPASSLVLRKTLGQHSQVKLVAALSRADFLSLLRQSACVVTDSGGVQEEAFVFDIPLVIARETTERPEVLAGQARFAGWTESEIKASIEEILREPAIRRSTRGWEEYGAGKASERIASVLRAFLR